MIWMKNQHCVFIPADASSSEILVTFSTSLTELDLDAIHISLTWLWISAGCLVQFFFVCCGICHQHYLSCTWKFFIVLASALLLGPSMIYVYGIFIILAVKLNLNSAYPTEQKTMCRIANSSLSSNTISNNSK